MGRTRTKAADRKAAQQRHTPPALERRANQVEAFFLTGVSVQPYTPEEHPETDVAQLQLLMTGQPAYMTRAESKLYTTFMLPQVALQLSDHLTSIGTALAERAPEGTSPGGVVLAGAGTNLDAVAAQREATEALRA